MDRGRMLLTHYGLCLACALALAFPQENPWNDDSAAV